MWWLIAVPLGFLFVLLLAGFVLGLLLHGAFWLGGLLVHQLPWLLLLFGAWLLLRPGGRGRYRRAWSTPASAPFAAAAPSGAAPAAAPEPRPKPKRELPIDLRVKVEQIRHKADVLLGYADRFPPFSHDLHVVRQTAADYLPRTVEAYLALPGDDDPVVGSAGKTALQELREQLELLDRKLDDIAQDLQRQDVDRLLANRRFLEERFRQQPPDDSEAPAP
jgi:hypothetical protein